MNPLVAAIVFGSLVIIAVAGFAVRGLMHRSSNSLTRRQRDNQALREENARLTRRAALGADLSEKMTDALTGRSVWQDNTQLVDYLASLNTTYRDGVRELDAQTARRSTAR
jgi:hypothetical protein